MIEKSNTFSEQLSNHGRCMAGIIMINYRNPCTMEDIVATHTLDRLIQNGLQFKEMETGIFCIFQF